MREEDVPVCLLIQSSYSTVYITVQETGHEASTMSGFLLEPEASLALCR